MFELEQIGVELSPYNEKLEEMGASLLTFANTGTK